MDFVNNIEESFFPSDEFRKGAHLTNINDYYRLYKLSIQDPDTFWLNIAQQFYWQNGIKSEKIFSYNFDINKGSIDIQFMKGSRTNACYNLVDRIVNLGLGQRIAYYW